MPATPGSEFNPLTILAGMIGTLLLISFLSYLYFAIVLTVIAVRSRTRNAFLAWIPIGNLFLMCAISRRPAWWVLLLLIPVVNVVTGVMLWMSIAEARGKPAWTGALTFLPGIGALVPIYLAAGPVTEPDAAPVLACPLCGTAAVPGDAFCGECGKPIPAGAKPTRRMAAGTLALAGIGMLLVVLLVSAGVGWFAFGRELAYTPPKRTAPALPARALGMMTEFPVDSASENPLRPDSVLTRDFRRQGANASTDFAKDWLPPAIDRTRLFRRANAMSSAAYRPTRPTAGASGSDGRGVYVHVLDTPRSEPPPGPELARDAAGAEGSKRTGVRVLGPGGEVFTGSRIDTPRDVTYVLDRQGGGITVIIYAPVPSLAEDAARLARGLGNGEGLSDYPEVKDSLWVLPAQPVEGLTLQDVNTVTPADVGLDPDAATAQAKTSEETRATRELYAEVRTLMPERITAATFASRSGKDWDLVMLDYGSPRRAWYVGTLIRWTAGLGGGQTVRVHDGSGLYGNSKDGAFLLFQRGPYVTLISAPAGTTADRILKLAEALQI